MKIKTKLLVLIFSILVAMMISIFLYIGFQNMIDKIEGEKDILELLNGHIKQEIIELSKFLVDSNAIQKQSDSLESVIQEKRETIKMISEFKSLPTISSDVEDALDIIIDLEDLQSRAEEKLYSAIEDLFENIEELDASFAIQDINRSKFKSLPNYNNINLFNSLIKKQLGVVMLTLESSQRTILDQYHIIDNYISKYERTGLITTIIIMSLSFIVSIIFSFTAAVKITRSIKKLESCLNIMATGNLIDNIEVKSNDEIGILSQTMGTFQNWLNSSLNKIKHSSKINEEVKEELIATTTETSSATVEISANINSIDGKINMLDQNIIQSKNDSLGISTFSNELNDFIVEQRRMVKESSDSISDMIQSISEISLMTNNNRDSVKSLELTALEGDQKLSETNEIIDDINASVNKINNMAEIIQDISDQTNLLSMNAAIEASHAGDAGKGFAVVADEIRKLAIKSANNSKDISQNLKDITGKFEDASSAGQKTREAFSKINDRIETLSEELKRVSASSSKLNTDGEQVLNSMDSLGDISTTVLGKSESMNNSAISINSLISDISDISTSVTCSISEVNVGFREITEAMNGLKKITNRVEVVSSNINREVNEFITS